MLPLALSLLFACDASAVDAKYWDRGGSPAASASSSSGGTANEDQGEDAGGGSPNTGASCLSVQFATLSYNGEYSPDNVGAAWIESSEGFVKTLEVWGSRRLKHAVAWRAASGGDTVDAITGATRRTHGPHAVRWDCTDSSGATLAAGPLALHIELTEEDSSEGAPRGPHRVLEFDTSAPGPFEAADDASVRAISGTVTSPP